MVSYKRHILKTITWRVIGTIDTMLLGVLMSLEMLPRQRLQQTGVVMEVFQPQAPALPMPILLAGQTLMGTRTLTTSTAIPATEKTAQSDRSLSQMAQTTFTVRPALPT